MSSISAIIKKFYESYSYYAICSAYKRIHDNTLFAGIFDDTPFLVEVRMKDDTLAMQINSDSLISTELLTTIRYFFENYNTVRNCVFTRKTDNITGFFREGIPKLINYGGKITLNLSDANKLKIISLMEPKTLYDKYKSAFSENFKYLETHGWTQFAHYVHSKLGDDKKKEVINKATSMELPLDWSNIFAGSQIVTGVYAETIPDGLILSLRNLGRVDMEYISQITGEDIKTVITTLKGCLYQNPDKWEECFYRGWETADEYLSGRVHDKLIKARKADKEYNGYFRDNVSALESLLPAGMDSDDIYITLGSPWVPAWVIDEFICHISRDATYTVNTQHDEESSIWTIPGKSKYKYDYIFSDLYGTSKINGIYILEKTLNMKPIHVSKEIPHPASKSGKKRVIDKEETILALEKQRQLTDEFRAWVWQDKSRRNKLIEIYEAKFGYIINRRYDGSFLDFPNMNKSERLYDYQKNAVARIILSPNTLLAHDVGAGKTYTMIAAGMEMKRMGISDKNMYVIPNNIISQWKNMFSVLYPKSNIFVVEPSVFKPGKRLEVLADIRDNDYDAVLIAYSCFSMIPLSQEQEEKTLSNEASLINNYVLKDKTASVSHRKSSIITDAMKSVKELISNDIIYFEDLKINTLFVDEAHNFKNIPIDTKIKSVLGISTKGSEKCRDMLEKVQLVQKTNKGRGIVFATGTPITNSMTDAYVMQKYLQSGELAYLGIQSFDAWVGMFAELESSVEVDVDTSDFRMTERFSKFHNMPELANILSSVADFYKAGDFRNIPEYDGYDDVIIPKSQELINYLHEISCRVERIRYGLASRTEDNMLKITTDGRKAALDIRLVTYANSAPPQSKLIYCLENVYDIYIKNCDNKSTQLIFCDISTPKAGFNLYNEIKSSLVDMGIPEWEIAFIHDADSESKKSALFKSMRAGEVRILIGSTFKLGLGVNVQNKLIALHHLDVPWRPADMIQREGRILRQGNENKKVRIFRYISEGSFDAYSWQLLETKQKMIRDLLSGCVDCRKCDEISDTVLSYAEVKAISIGNPMLKKRVELANELSHKLLLQKKLVRTRQNLYAEQRTLPPKIRNQNRLIELCKEDMAYYTANRKKYSKDERKHLRMDIGKAIKNNVLSKTEEVICAYQDFDIIIPVNTNPKKPFIYLKRKGKYHVDMGTADVGILKRIDFFLDNFEKHLNQLNDSLDIMNKRFNGIVAELKSDEDYGCEIKDLRASLDEIDEKLGVK